MSDDREDLIRRRAYELWEQAGGDHGQDQDHWHRASTEIGEGGQTGGTVVAPDGTTIGDVSDTVNGDTADDLIDRGGGASIVDAEVTTPAAPAAPAKPAARPRKSKTTK